MRITRSTLRRLIAEESARFLREAAEEESKATNEAEGGDGIPKMLHVMYRGFRPVFIVTDVDANPLDEADAQDVTQQIAPAESNMSTADYAKAIIDFITDESNDIMYVFDEEMNDSESDDKFKTEEYVNHLMSMMASGGADEVTDGMERYQRAGMSGEDEDLYEADKKGRVSPRKALGRYLASHGADDEAVFRAIDRALSRAEDTGEMPTSEDITFNLSDEILDAIPEDDSDKWHSMLEDVLADEFDADAFADAEAYRKDIEDTERDLSHPSRFLEEGDDDSDPDGGFMGGMASDEEMSYLRGGGSYSDSPYADNDVPDNRYTRGRAKGFNREPRVRGDDIDSGYDDDTEMGDNLSEGRWAKLAGILKS